MYYKENVLSSEQYVTGYELEEVLSTLDNRLIEATEYLKLRRQYNK